MEDSFNVRVGKIFGSLNPSSSSAPATASLSSLWCLTDAEIERREWNRDKTSPELEPEPEPRLRSSSVSADRRVDSVSSAKRDSHGEPREASTVPPKPDDYNDEEWEVKSSIGLDPTLDHEEEEDEYDKVAVDDEKPEDRLYMRDVEDYGIDIDSGNQLPVSFKTAVKDPRANHSAAKMRLKEDDAAAINIPSFAGDAKTTAISGDANADPNEAFNPKSILKRKDNQLDSKSNKRVRFDPECVDTNTESEVGRHKGAKDDTLPRVPDYLLNPSRYTCYTFDSSTDVSEDSNKSAYMDFLRALGKSGSGNQEEQNASLDPSRSVTFIPRKKTGDTSSMIESCRELVQQVGIGKDVGVAKPQRPPTCIAATDTRESMVCAMEEDEPEAAAFEKSVSHKPGRQYRTKASSSSELDE